MAVVTTNLGTVTAYGDAVAAGYTGTKAQWQALMANYATVGQQAAQDAQAASQAAQTATTKAGEASQSATRAEQAASSITTPDATLTQAGVAADAKATGDEISELKSGFTALYNTAYVTDSASGGVAHFTDGADDVPLKSLKVSIVPVQSGSGDPSPSNVRPISGWTGVRVAKAGKNLISPLSKTESGLTLTPQSDGGLLINGTYTGTTGWFVISSYVSLKAGQAYALSAGGTENTIGLNGYGGANPVTPTADFTSNLRMRIENGQTFDNVVIYPQVEVGATPTEFEIGTSEATNISLASAGTVYGGTLDVVSGELTVDKVATVGLSSYRKASGVSDGGLNYYDFAPSNYKLTEAIISSHLPMKTGGSAWASATPCATANATRLRLYIEADTESSYADMVVVYSLATPLTYQLSATEIKSLLGINNVWSDAGDTACEYRADTKLYIERLTEPDADMIADSNIVSGQYFMVGNSLYKATANIASGALVIVGTNAIRKSLSEALNEINA